MRNLHCPFCGYWPMEQREYVHSTDTHLFAYFCPNCTAKPIIDADNEGVPALRDGPHILTQSENIRRG